MKHFQACITSSCLVFSILSCTEPRVKRYQGILEPLIGGARRNKIDEVLGSPVHCQDDKGSVVCEYRTHRGRNEPVPQVFMQNSSMGPDLSPYEYFDVLYLYFDDLGFFKDWKPIRLSP